MARVFGFGLLVFAFASVVGIILYATSVGDAAGLDVNQQGWIAFAIGVLLTLGTVAVLRRRASPTRPDVARAARGLDCRPAQTGKGASCVIKEAAQVNRRHGYTDTELSLLMGQRQMLVDMDTPEGEANEMAQGTLDKAIAEAKADGTYDIPRGLGDALLGLNEPPSDRIADWVDEKRMELRRLRQEGVTDDDIRTWWNMTSVERRFAIEQDNQGHLAYIMWAISEGHTSGPTNEETLDEAAELLRASHPLYGDPDDTRNTTGDDRPLPYELKDRVNRYIVRRAVDPHAYKRDVDGSSTFNALIRQEIRASNL